MKKIIAILALTLTTSAFADPCCVHVPGGASGTCTLKAPINGACPGNGFALINIPTGVCPAQGAQPNSTQCTTVQSTATGTASSQQIMFRLLEQKYFINP